MQIKSNIAKVVEEVNYKAQYDAEIKKILSDPQILAWILKYTVREFTDVSIQEIIPCIEGNPEVAEHSVHPGYYVNPIEGEVTEVTELTAQRVTYDIRFKVRVPKLGLLGMIINVEAQNKFYESYDLVSRGVFYCARMLSTQIRNEESAVEYDHLQKVYSIWICLDAPLNSEYTITSYHMQREDVFGHMASTANWRFDLMEMVMVCLGRPEHAADGTQLHQLLTTVLSESLTPQEKIDTMKKNYEIITTVELEGRLAKMCNLSDYIEEKYMAIGLERGMERGLQRGMEKGMQQGLQQGMEKGMQQGLQQGLQQGMQQGMQQGIEQGLVALVNSLRTFIQGEEELYQAIVKNEVYQDFTREDVLKYLK